MTHAWLMSQLWNVHTGFISLLRSVGPFPTQLSDIAPEGGYARLAHTTQYIERETPPTATSTSAKCPSQIYNTAAALVVLVVYIPLW